jgi:tol-pal system protein YbgF
MRALWQIPALALASAGAMAAPSTDQRLERVEAQTARLGELTLDVDALKRENRELRGALEELQYEVEGLKKRIREVAADFDQRLSQPPSVAAPRTATPPQAQPAEPAARTAASDGAADAADYQKAYKLLEQKKYKEAVAAFQAYLKKYPSGSYRDNAYYWSGEANYVNQDSKAALADFQTVVEKFPKSDKMPGALLRIGTIQLEAGDRKKGESILNRVVKEFPDTTAARAAQKRLERLRADGR